MPGVSISFLQGMKALSFTAIVLILLPGYTKMVINSSNIADFKQREEVMIQLEKVFRFVRLEVSPID